MAMATTHLTPWQKIARDLIDRRPRTTAEIAQALGLSRGEFGLLRQQLENLGAAYRNGHWQAQPAD